MEDEKRKERGIRIAYLCDRGKECFDSMFCGRECRHTFDENHALFGKVDNPITSNRFRVDKRALDKHLTFWERDPESEVENK